MRKLNDAYLKIIRPASMDGNAPNSFYVKKLTLRDVICETVLPSPHRLVIDIIEKLKVSDKFTYTKDDMLKLSDKTWKFYDSLVKSSESFSLTFLRVDRYEYRRRFGSLPSKNVQMMEVVDVNDHNREFIWIDGEDEDNYVYDESFKSLLKHELGHVWTFKFGADDESFTIGQGPSNPSSLDIRKFSQYQLDVWMNLYGKNLALLEKDYAYVLKKLDENDSADFELATNIDDIIELLVADYFESSSSSTSAYLSSVWRKLSLDYDFSLDTLNLLKHYKKDGLYEGYSSIKHIKNAIRRLFLIFAFGTDEQIR